MKARDKDYKLAYMLEKKGITLHLMDINTLRRAALTLQRWSELECGDSNNYASWAIERDDVTNIPYFVTHPHDSNKVSRRRIADREKGALRRVKAVCDNAGLFFYHQGDPRGCSLYISREPLKDFDYNKGVPIFID